MTEIRALQSLYSLGLTSMIFIPCEMDKESLGDHQASIFILESRAYELPSFPSIPKMRYERGMGVASLF